MKNTGQEQRGPLQGGHEADALQQKGDGGHQHEQVLLTKEAPLPFQQHQFRPWGGGAVRREAAAALRSNIKIPSFESREGEKGHGAPAPAVSAAGAWGAGGASCRLSAGFSVRSSATEAQNRSASARTEKLPPQASVKLLAMERPRPLPSPVREASPGQSAR